MLKPKYIPTPLIPSEEKEVLDVYPITKPSAFRLFYLSYKALGFALGLGWLKVRGGWDPVRAARYTRDYLEALGGAWLKLGQILAMRNDLFSQEFCNELSKLHERANAFPTAVAMKIVEDCLDQPVEAVFDVFSEHPVAAASFAQVHKARLRRNGVWVAVKIQKPHADLYFAYDMWWIRLWFSFFNSFDIKRQFHWGDMLRELTEVIEEELDYRFEADSIRQMRKTLRRHRVYVPRVFDDYSNRRVLVMEYIEGVSVSEFVQVRSTDPVRAEDWLRENNIVRRRVARLMLHSTFRQIFEDNIAHADLHPGNVMLLRNSRIALIDFGSVGTFDREFMALYSQYLMALTTGNFRAAADLMLRLLGTLPPIDLEEVRGKMIRSMRSWQRRTRMKRMPFHEKSLSNSSNEIGEITVNYKFETNWSLLKLARTYSTLDMTLGAVFPEINYPKMIRGYFKEARRRAEYRQLASMLRVPQAVMSFVSMMLPRIRETMLSFRRAPDEIAVALGAVFKTIRLVFFAGTFVLVLAFVHWYGGGALERYLPTFVINFFRWIPQLTAGDWTFGLIVAFFVVWRFHKFTKRFTSLPQYKGRGTYAPRQGGVL